jgi:hypothetical protein
MLLGSSTTQILLLSLLVLLHILHTSLPVILKHFLQNLALSLTSLIAVAMALASGSGMVSMKKASLCAVFLPIPGSFVSSVMRFSMIFCSTGLYYFFPTGGKCSRIFFTASLTCSEDWLGSITARAVPRQMSSFFFASTKSSIRVPISYS